MEYKFSIKKIRVGDFIWKLNYFRAQRDLASSINLVIDEYWDDKINEHEMISVIGNL